MFLTQNNTTCKCIRLKLLKKLGSFSFCLIFRKIFNKKMEFTNIETVNILVNKIIETLDLNKSDFTTIVLDPEEQTITVTLPYYVIEENGYIGYIGLKNILVSAFYPY